MITAVEWVWAGKLLNGKLWCMVILIWIFFSCSKCCFLHLIWLVKLSGYRTGIQIQRHTGWISVKLSKLSQVNEAYHERVPDSSEGWEKQRVREEMGTVLSKKLTLRKVRSLIPHFQKLKVRVDLNLLALVTLTAFPSILRLLHCLNLSLRVGQPFQLPTPSPCFFMCTVHCGLECSAASYTDSTSWH